MSVLDANILVHASNRDAPEKIVARVGLGIVCFVVVAALGCIVYQVVKPHSNLSTALADAKADLAKAEATVESLVIAAKKAA